MSKEDRRSEDGRLAPSASAEGGSEETSPSLDFLRELARVPELRPHGVTPGGPVSWGEGDTLIERFVLGPRLGAGAFGTVHEAFDRERGATVALKLMRRRDAHALYLFKQEFRALADIAHPHLVRLYELHAAGEQWFFTLERLHGQDALEYARPGGRLDEARLRRLLAQMAEGLNFLHGAGKLHRDIKPSNVRVTGEDRVVLLDFGLVTDISGAEGAAGTPAYMAPELSRGGPVGPESDWYAVGVMLHQALTGQLPATRSEESGALAPLPSPLAPGLPEDLERLCRALLSMEPAARPTGSEVARLLRGESSSGEDTPRTGPRESVFVGRAAPLRQLAEAFAAARAGRTAVALVHGPSGMGKSALAWHFLEGLRSDGAAVVLAGRCFEQESVPYKALDSLMDAVVQHLQRLSPGRLRALLPPEAGALSRLFPVLGQLLPRTPPREAADGMELRRRALSALRELLAALARETPVVLFIDDLQWGDLDSVALVLEVLRAPGAPPVMLLATYRGDEGEANPVLVELLAGLRGLASGGLVLSDVPLGELEPDEAEALARELLAEKTEAAAPIAREAHGHPLFIQELARHAETRRAADEGARALDAVLRSRVEQLAEPARRLLEVVAVAGQPLPRASAARAAYGPGGESEELHALTQLRAGHLVRVWRANGRDELLPYHDRIRETVVAGLGAGERREYHHRLALTLEEAGGAEVERLVFHFREAGHPARAAGYALQAARRAHEALAFERSASLYRSALELGAVPPERAGELEAELGEALAGAGRQREAGEAFLRAAEGASPAQAVNHRRRAVQHLLLGGYTERGLEILTGVLREVGLRVPTTPLGTLLSLAPRRLWLKLRGLRFQPRLGQRLSERELLRIDVCWTAALGLSLVQPLRAADFQLRHVLMALRAGEPLRVTRALSTLGILAAFEDPWAADRLLAQAEELARGLEEPRAWGEVAVARSLSALQRGEWRRGYELLSEAEAYLRERCTGARWDLDAVHLQQTFCLWMLGEVPRLRGLAAELSRDARERGNLHCETTLRLMAGCMLELAEDRPDQALRTVDEAIEHWPRREFQLQHVRELGARLRVALYQGDGAEAWALCTRNWPELKGAGFLRVPLLRVEMSYLWATAALAVGAPEREVERCCRTMERAPVAWGRPLAALLRGVLAWRRGQREAALALLVPAEEHIRASGMRLIAAAVRRRRGELLGGAEGAALVAEADADMSGRGVRDPSRMAAMMVPALTPRTSPRDGRAPPASP